LGTLNVLVSAEAVSAKANVASAAPMAAYMTLLNMMEFSLGTEQASSRAARRGFNPSMMSKDRLLRPG
jgi:hypothetical protein